MPQTHQTRRLRSDATGSERGSETRTPRPRTRQRAGGRLPPARRKPRWSAPRVGLGLRRSRATFYRANRSLAPVSPLLRSRPRGPCLGAITESRTRRLQQSLSAQTLRGTEPRASTLCVITRLRPAAVEAAAVHEGIRTRDDGFEMPAVSLVGRSHEAGVIALLLEGLPERGAALVVRGHAGIGKSALLAQASSLATDRGMLVMSATDFAPGGSLPYAASAWRGGQPPLGVA